LTYLALKTQERTLRTTLTEASALRIISYMTAYNRGDAVYLIMEYRNVKKEKTDPTTLTATVYDPMGNKLIDAVDIIANKISDGVFFYAYTPASDAIMGSAEKPWLIRIAASDGSNASVEDMNFYLV